MPESRSRLTARKVQIEDVVNGAYYQQEGFDPNYVITPYGLRVSRARILATVVDRFVNDDESYGALTLDDGTETMRAKFFQDLEMMDGFGEGDIVEVFGKVKEYDNEMYVNPELIVHRGPNYELLRALELREVREAWREHVEKAKKLQDADKSDEDILQEMKGSGLREPEIQGIVQYLDLADTFESGGQIQAPTQTAGGATLTQAETHPTDAGGDGGADTGGGADADDDAEDDGPDQDVKGQVLETIQDLDDGDGADYGAITDNVDVDEDTMEDAVNDLLSDGTCYEPRPGRIKKL